MLSKAVYMMIPNAFDLFIGIGYSMSILGPAIGYVLGGQLLTMYIDIAMGQRQGTICFSSSFLFYHSKVNLGSYSECHEGFQDIKQCALYDMHHCVCIASWVF